MTKRDSRDENAKELNSSDPLRKQPQSLVEFLRQSPLMGLELDLERDKSPGRDIDLGFDEQDKS
jgi:hypothetical protein